MSIIANIQYHWLRKYKSIAGIYLKKTAQQRVEKLWQERKNLLNRQSTQLNRPLMINLTSFPARFETLHLTLKSLLLQDTHFDSLNLWLFAADIKKLPEQVLKLQDYGLSIKPVPADTRSYKKLIPALTEFPDAFHVTADDDIYYRENWLQELTSQYRGNDKEIPMLARA